MGGDGPSKLLSPLVPCVRSGFTSAGPRGSAVRGVETPGAGSAGAGPRTAEDEGCWLSHRSAGPVSDPRLRAGDRPSQSLGTSVLGLLPCEGDAAPMPASSGRVASGTAGPRQESGKRPPPSARTEREYSAPPSARLLSQIMFAQN